MPLVTVEALGGAQGRDSQRRSTEQLCRARGPSQEGAPGRERSYNEVGAGGFPQSTSGSRRATSDVRQGFEGVHSPQSASPKRIVKKRLVNQMDAVSLEHTLFEPPRGGHLKAQMAARQSAVRVANTATASAFGSNRDGNPAPIG
jgi:hypothetical protein